MFWRDDNVDHKTTTMIIIMIMMTTMMMTMMTTMMTTMMMTMMMMMTLNTCTWWAVKGEFGPKRAATP